MDKQPVCLIAKFCDGFGRIIFYWTENLAGGSRNIVGICFGVGTFDIAETSRKLIDNTE
jgi:hypothetical protein